MWKQYNPVEVISTESAFENLNSIIQQIIPNIDKNDTILLMTTKGMIKRAVAEKFTDKIACTVRVCAVDPEPDLDDLDHLVATLRGQKSTTPNAVSSKNLSFFNNEICHTAAQPFRIIVALGGGSVIDSAKAISCALMAQDIDKPLDAWLREQTSSHEEIGSQNRLHHHEKLSPHKKLSPCASIPLIAIPTTAGTGSEVTGFATIWDNKEKKKKSLASRYCYPRYALLDAQFTLTLPWQETLYGALDSFSHALETLWNKTATPMSIACAHGALAIVMDNLPKVEKNNHNIQARAKLQEAAFLAGMAISQSHSSLSHSISYPLTLHHKIPHGLSCAAFLLPIFQRVESADAFVCSLSAEYKERLRAFLTYYKPHHLIRSYCTEEDAKSLVQEMFTKARSETFVIAMQEDDVINIITSGFNQ